MPELKPWKKQREAARIPSQGARGGLSGLNIRGRKGRASRIFRFSLLVLLPLLFIFLLWRIPLMDRKQTTPRSPANEKKDAQPDENLSQLREGDVCLIKSGDCPIYDSAGKNAIRISSALFGEEVELLAPPAGGFLKGKLRDGTTGYFPLAMLSSDREAFSASEIQRKALVLSSGKRIMSHSMRGQLLLSAPMGSILYADYVGEELLRVRLPGGDEGWVNRDGLKLLGLKEAIPTPINTAAFFVSSAMNFFGSRFIPGGISREGSDMDGVIFIAARVCGLELPRKLEGQAASGEGCEIIYDAASGLPRASAFEPGDVLFFYDNLSNKKIRFAALILENGQALSRQTNDSSIVIRDLDAEPQLMKRLAAARRYFK